MPSNDFQLKRSLKRTSLTFSKPTLFFLFVGSYLCHLPQKFSAVELPNSYTSRSITGKGHTSSWEQMFGPNPYQQSLGWTSHTSCFLMGGLVQHGHLWRKCCCWYARIPQFISQQERCHAFTFFAIRIPEYYLLYQLLLPYEIRFFLKKMMERL